MKKGWQTKTLGEVLEKTETVNPLQSPNTEFDYIDVSSVSNTTFEIEETQRLKGKDAPSRARKLVRTNDIIFATIRPTLQRIAVVPEHLDKQVCSTGYFVLRPKQGIDHRFVFYSLFTEDFIGQMESLQKGASYPAVTDGNVRAQAIPVPPLPEQHRIVAILDEAFAGIATAKASAGKNLQNARAIFESYLQSVFTQQGKGWMEKRLDAIAEFSQGIQVGLADQSNAPAVGLVRFIRIIDYTQGTDDIRYVQDPGRRYWVEKSDIVMVRYGTPGLVGRGIEGVIANNLFKISIVDGSLTNDFLAHFLGQQKIQNYLSSQGSSTMPALTFTQLGAVTVSFPNDFGEQNEIVSKLDSLREVTQRLARIYEQKLAALEALKKSLLNQAFTGEL